MGFMIPLEDLIDMARRRARLLAVVIAAGCVFSALFALSQPRIYQSTVMIRMAGPSAFDPQIAELHLTTRGALLQIINAYTLYDELPDLSPDAMVTRLRQAVRFQSLGGAEKGPAVQGAPSFLSISAQMASPMQARLVAQEFGQRAVRLGREARIDQAQSRITVLTAQEGHLRVEITSLQDQTTDMRRRHDVPTAHDMDLRRAEISRLDAGLLGLEQDRLVIVRDAARVDRPALAQRKQAELAEQLATLSLQRDLLQKRKTQLEHSLGLPLGVAQKLAGYARRQQQLAVEIDALSARNIQAKIGLEMVRKTLLDQVAVIDPAIQPELPISGSRMRIALIGMALSMALALVLACGLEQANPVIRTPRQMQRRVGYAPIVSIPYLDPIPPKVTRWQRFLAWLNGPESSGGSTA